MVQFENLLPQGVETLVTEEYAFKDEILNNVKSTFRSFGYRQVLTPTFEYFDMYKDLFEGINFRHMIKFISPQGDVMVLRPDATIPVARMAAKNYGNPNEYLKFFYTAPIFRQSETQKGDEREFLQAGIEYFANAGASCDAEVIAIGIQTLLNNGIQNFRIDLGQVDYLSALLEEAEPDPKARKRIIELIESKNSGELGAYLDQRCINEQLKDLIVSIIHMYGDPKEILPLARQNAINVRMRTAIDNCEEVLNILKDYGYQKYMIIDMGFTNPLDYYTGVIFKGYIENFGKAVIQGGRYDRLTQNFGTSKPACGFGININDLTEIISTNKLLEAVVCYTDILIIYQVGDRKEALLLASKLRAQGYIVETEPLADIDSQKNVAAKRYIRDMIVIKDQEIETIGIIKNGVTNDIMEVLYRG